MQAFSALVSFVGCTNFNLLRSLKIGCASEIPKFIWYFVRLSLSLHELRKVEFMKLHLSGHWLSKWAPMEAAKQYPLGCDVIDDKQSVSQKSLLFLLLSVIPLQSLLSL